MFEDVKNMLTKAINLDYDVAFDFAINTTIKNKIIELNTIEQLFKKGIDSDGASLGEYSPFTVEAKKLEGKRFDHITLNDDGDFYNSFRVSVSNGSITISATDTGKYDIPLTEDYGKEIIGLTDESLEELIKLITPRIILYVEKTLGI